MKVKVAIMNAFIDGDTGGNPAGVVLDADSLSEQQKLDIAKKIGLSETAFVSQSSVADFKLDFFTPEKQIAHCGHATIATFSYLSQLDLITGTKTSKETIDGTRDITIAGRFAFMEQRAPRYQAIDAYHEQVAQALGLAVEDITAKPVVANTGNAFIVLGVKSIAQLQALKPDFGLIDKLSEQFDLIGFYVFTLETNKAGRDASSRMFAPRYGILEESATGMAAGPLACYLHDHLNVKKDSFVLEQGYAMTPSSPSCIEVNLALADGKIQSLTAGGIGMPARFEQLEI